MSADAQRWLPLAPAAVVTLYWFIGLAVFTVHSAIWAFAMIASWRRAASRS